MVEWLDIFNHIEYKEILLESLRYCQKNKSMEVFAWCIMSNHVHLAFRTVGPYKPRAVLGDFKKFTSQKLLKAIESNPRESRKEWLLEWFRSVGNRSSNVKNYQLC